jgi:hypothetical protein
MECIISIQDIYIETNISIYGYIDILLSYKNDIVIFFKIQVFLNVVNYFQQFQHPFDFWVAMEVSFSLAHLAFQSLFSHHLSVAK